MQWAVEPLVAGNLTLVIHDPAHDVATDWWNATAVPGHDFDVTIICYTEQDPGVLSFQDGGTTYSQNITLTVPADAEPGIHTGFVDWGGLIAPYSYVVAFNMTEPLGNVNTLFEDWGDDLTPYDNVLYGAMDEDPDDWDFRSYVLYNPSADADYLGVRAEFPMGTDLYISVIDAENSELAHSSALTDTSTAVIAELDGTGYYYLLVHPIAQCGTIAQPVTFTLETILYDDLTDQAPTFSWTSDDTTGATVVTDGDTATGDHVY
jgi:hypothetical protein